MKTRTVGSCKTDLKRVKRAKRRLKRDLDAQLRVIGASGGIDVDAPKEKLRPELRRARELRKTFIVFAAYEKELAAELSALEAASSTGDAEYAL